ncbi:phosphoglycerate dehydrogenase-like enzyme [Spinactinospora alkalitolerans]|uniref:Phosphoglycerate dehydrogenase-like enzyme n=1 Tax=Spinactinospora alkalitolerans TaxID=687207 RepID=A0A852U4I2_9ACTN|nr:D-2-hydroxyacid dehydrogenase [Spinactinospora alkalitolerans]NYE50425.1 phosphoglycerate dehydrogenase-like enzyme [Spinactinospora alkalitolerans]
MSNEPPHLVVLHGDDLPPNRDRIDADPRLASVRYATADRLAEALPGARALFVWDLFSEAVAAAWPKADSLRWVHAATAGVDNLMFPALVDSDVVVTNSRGVFDQPMAEYVVGLVLSFAKDFQTSHDLQRRRLWRHRETERVGGRRALVVGTGPIGRAIARGLSAIGMTVEGVGRVARDSDPDFGTVVASGDLAEALPRADYVVLAAPLTDATRGLIDAAALERMKPTARLINVGRGPLVVEDDLVAALRDGAVAGAALDVFETEPLPESSPLWDLPGVVVSPHMSGDVVGWREELVELFLANLDRFLTGRDPHNIVDKHRGYVSGS